MQTIEVKLGRGTCPVRLYGSTQDHASPIVLSFRNAFGPRPTLDRRARLAGTAARIYVGIADIDPTFDSAEAGRLAEASRSRMP